MGLKIGCPRKQWCLIIMLLSYMFIHFHICSYIFIHCHYHFPHSMDLKDGIAPSVRHTPKWPTASLRATWMESCSARSLQLWHLLRLTLWWKIQNGRLGKTRRNGRFSWENNGKWLVIWENLWTQWASVNSSECRNVVNCMASDSPKGNQNPSLFVIPSFLDLVPGLKIHPGFTGDVRVIVDKLEKSGDVGH